MNKLFLLFISVCSLDSFGQKPGAEKSIQSGNQFYRDQKYIQASEQYSKALNADPDNQTAKFNLANSLFKQDKKLEAVQLYADLAAKTDDRSLRSKTWYNKGVILTDQKNLEGSIEAYKNALRNEPNDKEARENLQKALLELKKKNEEKKKQDQQKKNKDEQQKKQPQSKMQPKEAEQRLRLLQQKEKEVQERVQKQKARTGGSQVKDW